tara:strand:- start:217 stop:327 length:111 start_codon:yes stop_codon:yes gene_type:complete
MFDFWTSIIFLCIALPISLGIMIFIFSADSKKDEDK